MNARRSACCAVGTMGLLFGVALAPAQSLPPRDEHDVVLETLPESASEGLLLGNGTLGVSVHGGRRLMLTLGRTDLWDRRPPPEFQTDEFSFETLAKAVESGDSRTLSRIFETPFERSAWPCRLPVARITLDFPPGMEPTSARLSIARAEVEISLAGGGQVELFVDAEQEVGRLRVRDALPANVVLEPARSQPGVLHDLSLSRLGYPACESDDRSWSSWLRQEIFGGERFADRKSVV